MAAPRTEDFGFWSCTKGLLDESACRLLRGRRSGRDCRRRATGVPALIAVARDRTRYCFLEFFPGRHKNPNTCGARGRVLASNAGLPCRATPCGTRRRVRISISARWQGLGNSPSDGRPVIRHPMPRAYRRLSSREIITELAASLRLRLSAMASGRKYARRDPPASSTWRSCSRRWRPSCLHRSILA
jgi:hypothetical protein